MLFLTEMTFTRGNISIEVFQHKNDDLSLVVTNTDTLRKYHSVEINFANMKNPRDFLSRRLNDFSEGSNNFSLDLRRLKIFIDYNNDFEFIIDLVESEENKHINRCDVLEARIEKLQRKLDEITRLNKQLKTLYAEITQKSNFEKCKNCISLPGGYRFYCEACERVKKFYED